MLFSSAACTMQVNRKGDEIAQMATEYSALEIAYFKAVVRLSFSYCSYVCVRSR